MVHRRACEFACDVSIANSPPFGMASRALTTRFMMTCSSWPGSAFTWPSGWIRSDDQLDVFPDEAPEHTFYISHDGIQPENFWFQGLLSAEGHELPNQGRGPLPAFCISSILARIGLPREVPQEDLAVAHDHGQQIVEIMREAPGETADGFHLLGLPKLLFAHAEGILRPSAFESFVEITQCSLDRRHQTPEALLEYIVGGPLLHQVDGEFFALRARDEQEWHVGVQRPGQGERGGSVKSRDELSARMKLQPSCRARRETPREFACASVSQGMPASRKVAQISSRPRDCSRDG